MFTCYPIRKASFYSSRSNKYESLHILYVISEVFFLWYSILSPGRSGKDRSPSPPATEPGSSDAASTAASTGKVIFSPNSA